jgi:surface protein
MFSICSEFNQPLSDWDVSNVKNMASMFSKCEKFNQDLSEWNVSKVKNMSFMFSSCKKFNQDLSKWNVSEVKDMSFMFYNCTNFSKPLNWKLNKDTNVDSMLMSTKIGKRNDSEIVLKKDSSVLPKIINLKDTTDDIKTFIYFNPDSKENEYEKVLLTKSNNIFLSFKENDKLIIYPTLDDKTPELYLSIYNEVKNRILQEINSSDNLLCEGLIISNIEDEIKIIDAIIVISNSLQNILSFALIKFKFSTTGRRIFFVEILCSHKYTRYAGKYLIQEIDKISKICNFDTVELLSVPSAVEFYKKCGFTNEDPENKNYLIKKIKRSPLSEDLTKKNPKIKGGNKIKKFKKTKRKILKKKKLNKRYIISK